MLNCSDTFKSNMKIYGKQINVLVQYKNTTWDESEVVGLEQNINGELFTSVCRALTLELEKVENVTFEKETEINIKLGVKIDDDEEYEYIDWGKFVIRDVKDCVDTKSHKLELYDHLIDTHIKYQDEPLDLDYSNDNITVKDLLQAVCNKFGFTLKTLTFANSNKIVYEDKYLNLDVTYRDILDEIAGCAGGFIKIFNKDLYVAYPQETKEVIDEEDLKSLDIGNKVGAFNTLVLSRAPQEDNIFYPTDIAKDEKLAIRIENNQIMDKNREDFIVGIYNKINGLQYYVFECEHYGFGYFEFGDIVTIKDLDGNSYKTILLNIVDNINTGITGKQYAEETEFAETKYEYASSLEKRIKNTEIICDKQNGEIKLLAEEQAKYESKVAKIELDIDTIKTTVSQNTTNIANIKSDAVNEAIKATEKELGIKLKDYPTTAQVSTIIETKAGEIETKLNGTITAQMSNYVTKTVMENSITASINGFSSTVSQTYLTKTNASNDFVEKKKVISSINQSAEAVSISANKINLNGAVTANNYFKINLDGSIEASSGKIAGIDISSGGLYYSGSSVLDGFGLWKAGSQPHNGSYIIFHAGGNNANIGGAPFRVYQNGKMFASSGKIGPFTLTDEAISSASCGMTNNQYWAFWADPTGATSNAIYRVTWNGNVYCADLNIGQGAGTWNSAGHIACNGILVGGQPLIKTTASDSHYIKFMSHNTSYIHYEVEGYGAFGINIFQSDENLKRNIEKSNMNASEIIKAIEHYRFYWVRNNEFVKLGYVAQQLEKLNPDLVLKVKQPEGSKQEYLCQINEPALLPHITKCLQEVIERLERVEEKIL